LCKHCGKELVNPVLVTCPACGATSYGCLFVIAVHTLILLALAILAWRSETFGSGWGLAVTIPMIVLAGFACILMAGAIGEVHQAWKRSSASPNAGEWHPGSHLYVKYTWFEHHGIYIGTGQVIHNSKLHGRVGEASLDDFRRHRNGRLLPVKACNYEGCFPPD